MFEAQMRELAATRRVMPIDDALSKLHSFDAPAVDPVVVTFDDGTADWIDQVLPILVSYHVSATFYVATDFIERRLEFPSGGRPVSWAGLADAVSTGLVTVGSHTHTHALLDRLPPADVAEELTRSCRLIEDRLSVGARHFAYPKAVDPSPDADALVRRHFSSAALAGTRSNPYGRTDPFRLHRSPIQRSDGMRWFREKACGGMRLEDVVRRTANRVRYRAATA